MFVQLVFEKAVDEPGLSSAYARMCQELAKNEVPSSADPTKKANTFCRLPHVQRRDTIHRVHATYHESESNI